MKRKIIAACCAAFCAASFAQPTGNLEWIAQDAKISSFVSPDGIQRLIFTGDGSVHLADGGDKKRGVTYCQFMIAPQPGTPVEKGTVMIFHGAVLGYKLEPLPDYVPQAALHLLPGAGTEEEPYWQNAQATISLRTQEDHLGYQSIVIRYDHHADTWDLYLNGTMVRADLPAYVKMKVDGFVLFPGAQGVVNVMGDVKISKDNPLFADANTNGIPDDFEKSLQLNPAQINHRSKTLPGRPETLLSAYQQSLRVRIPTHAFPTP